MNQIAVIVTYKQKPDQVNQLIFTNVYLNYPLTYIGREMFNNINDKNMNSTLLKWVCIKKMGIFI